MDKETAIKIAKEYIYETNNKQPISIDSREIIDEDPTEFDDFWCFKAYYEELNPMRENNIKINTTFPFYLISKKSKKITLIDWSRYSSLKNE